MCDNPCQPAHFGTWEDWVIFPHSGCHGRPGAAPLGPEGGALPPRLSPTLGSGKASTYPCPPPSDFFTKSHMNCPFLPNFQSVTLCVSCLILHPDQPILRKRL